MGSVTSLFAHKVVEEVGEGVDKAALLRTVGLERGELPDPSHMLSAAEYYEFLERVAQADPLGVTIPLRAGAAMRCDDYGAFGLAWKSAPTLGASYARAERYARVLTSVSAYEVEAVAEGAYMHLHRAGERHLGMRLSNEASIASIASISRQVSTVPFRPLAAFFKHAAPATTEHHEAYFGCPVRFGSDRDALLVPTAVLRAPNKLGDPGLSRFFETHLEEKVAELAGATPADRHVRDYVGSRLSEGVPPVFDAAQHLGMSTRTLQRRLREEGWTYQALVDDVRRQLAQRLLRQTQFSLIEVAFMTGFSGQSAFTRAFKRWAGQTPRSFRLRAQSVGVSA